MRKTVNHEQLFWSRVRKEDHVSSPFVSTSCWIYIGPKNPERRYGSFPFWEYGVNGTAHRYSYYLSNGPIPDGVHILHHCDRCLCVNGDHLFDGTQRANMHDMIRKGRAAYGDRHPSKTSPDKIPRGSRVNSAKLNDVIVVEVRRLYRDGGVSINGLARMFGVNGSTMWEIVRGRTWKHVA